jgi:hypothetical protein
MKLNYIQKVALVFITQVVIVLFPMIFTVDAISAGQAIKDTGSIVGSLKDKDGKPVQGVLVTALNYTGIENNEMKFRFYFNEGRLPEVMTDNKGGFKIDNIPLGKWALRTTAGLHDKGDFIRVKSSDGTEIILIVEIGKERTVNVGNVLFKNN